MARRNLAIVALCGLAILAGCERERPLPGERVDLRAPLDLPETAPAAPASRAFPAPQQQRTTAWTHRGGNAQHATVHAAMSPAPRLAWTANIGTGNNRRHRITADPVVAGGRIFTLDSRANVVATSTGGGRLWSRDLTPETEREDEASGGGLATDGSRVYVTSGFGRLTALDAASGAVIWSQRLDAASTSAPTVVDGTVYAVSTNSRGWAIDAATGRIRWEVSGAPSPSGVFGGGAPAVTDRLVLLPFHSGDLVAVLKLSGLRVWNAPVSGRRLGKVYAQITDLTGDPVVSGSRIYAGNHSGRTLALDANSGERIWTAESGSLNPPVVAGGSVFIISDQNDLVRLDASTGEEIWSVELPLFANQRVRRRERIYAHYGPVLAGGRLVVASTDDTIRFFDPASGALVGTQPLRGGAVSLPAVVDSTLYVVSGRGELHAFR